MVKNIRTITKRVLPLAQNSPAYYALTIEGSDGWLLTGIDLCVRGNVILSAGTASGTQSGENPGGIFNNIQIDATAKPNGLYRGGKIKNLTPRSLLRRNIFDMGRFQDDLTGAIAGTAATTAINLRLPLRFALPRLVRPMETALRLDQFSQILLTFNMASIASMMVGNDRTVDWTGLYIEVVEKRVYTVNAQNPTGFWPLGTLFDDDRFIQIGAANSRFSIDTQLPKSESYIDALMCTESTASKTLVDTVLNRATVYQASEFFEDLFERDIRMMNNDNKYESATTSLAGLYYWDFTYGTAENGLGGPLSNVVPFVNYVVDISNPGGANLDDMLLSTRRFAPRLADPPKSHAA